MAIQGSQKALQQLIHMLQGSIKGYEHSYQLDDHHVFQTGKPMLVCGNTAAMVGEDGISWLSKHFQVNVASQLIHLIIIGLAYAAKQLFSCVYHTPASVMWVL